jgi:hypothetical protein
MMTGFVGVAEVVVVGFVVVAAFAAAKRAAAIKAIDFISGLLWGVFVDSCERSGSLGIRFVFKRSIDFAWFMVDQRLARPSKWVVAV